jgi:hypothetical protein
MHAGHEQTMQRVIEQLQRGDLSAFQGARLRLSLPFKQDLLNEGLAQLVARKQGALKELRLELREGNQVEVRLSVRLLGLTKSLGFELQVERDLGFPASAASTPKLKMALPATHALLSSILEILTSSLGLLPGGIAIVGRVIEVDLEQAVSGPDATPEAQARARAFIKLVKWGEIETRAGVLVLNLGLEAD